MRVQGHREDQCPALSHYPPPTLDCPVTDFMHCALPPLSQDSFWNFGDGPSPPPPIKTCQGSEKEVAVGKETGAAAPAPDLLGLDIWPGALALCNYLAMHPSLVGCRRVLELGAGMGLPALLAAKLGCSSALLTDYEPLVRRALGGGCELMLHGWVAWAGEVRGHFFLTSVQVQAAAAAAPSLAHNIALISLLSYTSPFSQSPLPSPPTPFPYIKVLELAAENIRLNGVGDIAATHRLDWEDPQGTLAPGHPHSFHVVLAADVLYISDIVLPFVGMLQTLLHPEGGRERSSGGPGTGSWEAWAGASDDERHGPSARITHPSSPIHPGIALVAHQTRRPLVLDPETGVPGLSRRDEPYEAFQAAVRAAGLVPRQLGALDAGGSAGPLYLSALAWEQAYIATLEPVARLRPLKG